MQFLRSYRVSEREIESNLVSESERASKSERVSD